MVMSADSSVEAGLLSLAMAGDRMAFAALVRKHQSMVRNQLRRLTRGDAALADDLSQDAFIQAWRHLASYRGHARFSTWLYRIAYNRFLMHARGRKDTLSLDAEDAPEQAADPDALHTEARPAMRLDVERALQQLPEQERIAIIHCYHLDLSHDEAAAVLGIPLGTLKSHVLRGKARLRELLAAWATEIAS